MMQAAGRSICRSEKVATQLLVTVDIRPIAHRTPLLVLQRSETVERDRDLIGGVQAAETAPDEPSAWPDKNVRQLLRLAVQPGWFPKTRDVRCEQVLCWRFKSLPADHRNFTYIYIEEVPSMAIHKSITVALSTVALAGITVFTSGSVTAASAQTASTAAQQVAAVPSGDRRWGDGHGRHNWHRSHHHWGGHHGHWGGGHGRWWPDIRATWSPAVRVVDHGEAGGQVNAPLTVLASAAGPAPAIAASWRRDGPGPAAPAAAGPHGLVHED
jgi:hypothetical protein